MRVLVIEGDIPSARALELILTTEGFNVTLSDSGEEGIDLAKVYDFDVITLDLKLPDMSGFDVIRRLRAAKVNTPVLILSGMALVTDIVKALGAGADDYLTKPAHNDELVARLQTLVRRCKGFAVSVITTGNISLDLSTQTMKISGKSFPLTGKEYAIMQPEALHLSLPKVQLLAFDASGPRWRPGKRVRMSKSIADVYSATGHIGASLNCGEVTVTIRNAIGEHTAMQMSLHSWCAMIEASREIVQMAEQPKEPV